MDSLITPQSSYSPMRSKSSVHMFLLSNQKGNVRRSDTEARLCNHCCRENAISIIYSECVSVA